VTSQEDTKGNHNLTASGLLMARRVPDVSATMPRPGRPNRPQHGALECGRHERHEGFDPGCPMRATSRGQRGMSSPSATGRARCSWRVRTASSELPLSFASIPENVTFGSPEDSAVPQ